MDSSNLAVALQAETPVVPAVHVHDDPSAAIEGPPALLRGTSRGLEMQVNGKAPLDAILDALTRRLEEAPGFFRGSNVRIAVENGPLPRGYLARLDELAARFELAIVEIGAAKAKDPVPRPNLAAGSGPTAEMFGDEEPTGTKSVALLAQVASAGLAGPIAPASTGLSEPVQLAEAELTAMLEVAQAVAEFSDEPTQNKPPLALAPTPEIPAPTEGTRLVIGPVRSGVILEHEGHMFVFGDVNPGAEVRATGNIIVLGRLRGTAHAAIGQDVGFILALRLEPQQLRIGRKVTRAGEDAAPPTDSEIAYIAGDAIVVERYLGKLPRNLATSI
jgi:septum formation inhibitor MinC